MLKTFVTPGLLFALSLFSLSSCTQPEERISKHPEIRSIYNYHLKVNEKKFIELAFKKVQSDLYILPHCSFIEAIGDEEHKLNFYFNENQCGYVECLKPFDTIHISSIKLRHKDNLATYEIGVDFTFIFEPGFIGNTPVPKTESIFTSFAKVCDPHKENCARVMQKLGSSEGTFKLGYQFYSYDMRDDYKYELLSIEFIETRLVSLKGIKYGNAPFDNRGGTNMKTPDKLFPYNNETLEMNFHKLTSKNLEQPYIEYTLTTDYSDCSFGFDVKYTVNYLGQEHIVYSNLYDMAWD